MTGKISHRGWTGMRWLCNGLYANWQNDDKDEGILE